MNAASLPSPGAASYRVRAILRMASALASTSARVAVGANPPEEIGAVALGLAPNCGRPSPSAPWPGETLVNVGPPDAILSLEIVGAASPQGTVFLLHGIRDSKGSMRHAAERFAAAGYRAVLVDSRGHGRSSGDALTYGVQESKDLVQVLSTLEARGDVVGQVGVFGFSYGAATAIQWAGRDPRVRAVVAVSSFASLRDIVPGYLHMPLPRGLARRAVDLAGERGGFDPEEASPLAAIGATSAPVLLVHGKRDFKIPVSHSERLFERGKGHAELVVVARGAHDDLLDSREAKVAERAVGWFEERLSR